jgi:RNA 2',3'-cyclic 3'-phosphodiesterase
MSGDAVRAFVALELDEAMREKLRSVVDELRGRLRDVSWVRPEGIHLTLRFLGPARPPVLDEMKPRLRAAASHCSPASPLVAGLGVFPERGRARVLWIDIAVPPAVLALQAECEAAAVAAGFAPEPRPFRPHLTLGRWREGAPRPELPSRDLGPASLRHLALYSSEHRPDGTRYRPLERFALGEAG